MNPPRNASGYWINIARIVNFFRRTSESGFLFCTCDNQRLIQEINRQITEQTARHGLKVGTVYISFDEIDNLLTLIRHGAQQSPNGVILNNLNELIRRSNGRVISELNMGREILIDINVPMLFWLSEENISRFANRGTDLFNRRDRSVVVFSDLTGVSKSMERLDEFYQLGFKDSESYANLSLKIELMEKQFAEAKRKNVPEERIAFEIAADLIRLFLDASLYPEAFQLFESYQGYYVNSEKIEYISLCGKIFHKKGEWDQALDYYRKSEQIHLEVGDRAGLAYTFFNIGLIYLKKNEKQTADPYLMLAGYIAHTQGMKHALSQMAWALNPLIEAIGMERFMEEGKRLCAERGII